MKTDLRRFSPLGLGLAALATIAFVGALLTKGLAVGGVFTLPDMKVMDQVIWGCLAAVILGLALTALLDPDGARKFFIGRQLQYGSNAVITLVAFIGILIFVNMIVYQYSSTLFPAWDMTDDQQNTLASETLNILKTLPQPVVAHAYYTEIDETTQKLLDNFKRNSDGKFTYEVINPNFEPLRAQSDGVTRNGTIVMRVGTRIETVTFATEEELDTTLLKLISSDKHTVYFLEGHQERVILTAGEDTISQIKATLEKKNYTVEILNLANQKAVPENADALIIAGPQKPLLKEEVAIIEAYLDKGGSLIVMEDPRELTKFGDAPDPLADLTAKWGINFEDDIVVDGNATNPLFAIADPQNYSQHPITNKLIGYTIAFYTARSLKLSQTPPAEINNLTILAQTYSASVWGETTVTTEGNVSFDAQTDINPPLTLVASAEKPSTKGRLVVFGDSDFATNAYEGRFSDILINAVDWATQQEKLISLTPRNKLPRSFIMPDTATLIVSVLLSICAVPLLVVLAAAWAWYSRRRRG